jgi:predicted ArsR family transcriptional regulator
MPNTDAGLPFSGSSPLARHTSHQGADDAKARALPQVVVYLALLKQAYPDGYTDAEAAARMGVERTSINARRKPLEQAGLVESHGTRERASSGNPNVVWRLAAPARTT